MALRVPCVADGEEKIGERGDDGVPLPSSTDIIRGRGVGDE